MSKFLSASWFEDAQKALDEAAGLSDLAEGKSGTIQHVVACDGADDVRYYVTLSGGRPSIVPGEADEPTATLTSDYETAARLNREETTVQEVRMSGALQFLGDLGAVMSLLEPLEAIDKVIRTVPADY